MLWYCVFQQQGAQGSAGTDGIPGAKGDQVCLNNDNKNDDYLYNCRIPDQFLAIPRVGQATIEFLTCAF